MKAYRETVKATFLSRPNRFIAHVLLEGQEVVVHVKNTGRCRELLYKGVTVYLAAGDNPARKTRYDLVAVEKRMTDGQTQIINIDSQLPNAVAEEYLRASGLFPEDAVFKREVTHGDSRFDLCVTCGDKVTFVEVKGVTLEQNGVALFPDAPTERGIKHLKGLVQCIDEGYDARVLFVIQMKDVTHFSPNDVTHPAFGEALRCAARAGVKIMAVDCLVTPDSLTARKPVQVVM